MVVAEQIIRFLGEELKEVAAEERAEERAVESGEIATALIRKKTKIEVKEKEINVLKEYHEKRIQEQQELHLQEVTKLAKVMEELEMKNSNKLTEIRAENQAEMDVKFIEKADLKLLEADLQMKLVKNMQCSDGDGLSDETKVENTVEMAATLAKVKTNIEGTKAEIKKLEARQKCQDEEFSRMQDAEIKAIKEKYDKKVGESRELNKLQITAKEKDLTEHESLEREIRSKLLQSLSVPVPEEKVPECPACMEKMKPPLQIFNCPNGHLICSDCKPNVPGNRCTDCKTPYAGRANGTEKIVRSLMNLD